MPSTTLPSTSPAAPPRSVAKTRAGQRHQDGADEHHPPLAEAVGRLPGRDGEQQRDDGEGGGERARARRWGRPARAPGTPTSGAATKVMTWVSVECSSRTASSRRPGSLTACSSGPASRSADRAPRLVSTCRRISSAAASAVAVPDGLEQRPVLGGPGVALLVAAPGLEAVPAVAVGLHPEPVEDVDQQGVVRGAMDGGVEPVVALQLGERRAGAQRLESVERGADLGEVGLGAALRGERRGQRVEAAPQLQQVARLGGVQRPHPRVRWASSSTRPSCLSRRSASRRGVVLMPIVCASAACGRTAPGASSPERMSPRTRV